MNIDFNLNHLFKITIWLSILYLIAKTLLFLARDWVSKSNIKWQKKYIKNFEVTLTPLICFLFIVLILIYNPLGALIIVTINYLFFKDFIRNYLLGIYFKLNNKLIVSTNINSVKLSGRVDEFAALGIWVNTDTGLKFISYKGLYKNGFTLNDSSHISTLHTIKVEGNNEGDSQKLNDLLIGSPYLDSQKNIIIDIDDNIIIARVNLRNQDHHNELVSYLQENNFTIIKE